MPAYRAYLLSNNRIEAPPKIIEAADDGAAIEQARQLVDGHDVELWCGNRCILVLKRANTGGLSAESATTLRARLDRSLYAAAPKVPPDAA